MIRTTYRFSAWGMLASLALAYVCTIPSVSSRVQAALASTVGYAAVSLVLALIGIDILVLWISAILYAWNRLGYRSPSQRGWTTALFVVGNFPVALIYYFAIVARRHDVMTGERSASGTAEI